MLFCPNICISACICLYCVCVNISDDDKLSCPLCVGISIKVLGFSSPVIFQYPVLDWCVVEQVGICKMCGHRTQSTTLQCSATVSLSETTSQYEALQGGGREIFPTIKYEKNINC